MAIIPFRRLLCANRGEIAIRVFRAATELGIRTVAIFSEEDRVHLHRYKADEAYLVGQRARARRGLPGRGRDHRAGEAPRHRRHPPGLRPPVRARLVRAQVPRRGHRLHRPDARGDRRARRQGRGAQASPRRPACRWCPARPSRCARSRPRAPSPTRPAIRCWSRRPRAAAGAACASCARPASSTRRSSAPRSEARKAFGDDSVFLEKLVVRPKHIEVQVLGDNHGNLVHLFERDCCVQRRHQKVVEYAPAWSLPEELRARLAEDALKVARQANYTNAGTVEFLVGEDGAHYFIEVNPRIQVEHTVTEVITGRDLVQAQIRIAQGYSLADPEIGMPNQAVDRAARRRDPGARHRRGSRERLPPRHRQDRGLPPGGRPRHPPRRRLGLRRRARLAVLRLAAGEDHRLAASSGTTPAARWCARCASSASAASRPTSPSSRTCSRTRRSPPARRTPRSSTRRRSWCSTRRAATARRASCATSPRRWSTATPPCAASRSRSRRWRRAVDPAGAGGRQGAAARRARSRSWSSAAPTGWSSWLRTEHRRVRLTDTTWRDAHQSLLATRVRTYDLARIAPATAHLGADFFSLEMWGGATFDVAYRFLSEDPWLRLEELRRLVPNVMFQMLVRGANAVGYTNYPDDVVGRSSRRPPRPAWTCSGSSTRSTTSTTMQVAIEAAQKTGRIVETAICYTGDVSDPRARSTTSSTTSTMAKEIVRRGTHLLASRTWPGLLEAARRDDAGQGAASDAVDVPLHLHMHDTSGNSIASYMAAIEAGVDVVDGAVSSMAGMTSQPSLSSLAFALAGAPRDPAIPTDVLRAAVRLLGAGARVVRAVRVGPEGAGRRRLRARDPGRPVLEPARAGRGAGRRRAAAGRRSSAPTPTSTGCSATSPR